MMGARIERVRVGGHGIDDPLLLRRGLFPSFAKEWRQGSGAMRVIQLPMD